jgi:hypothetical protein
MVRTVLALSLTAVIVGSLSGQHRQQPLVTFDSPTECQNAHGVWRWAAKTDLTPVPASIPPGNHVRPSDIAAWGGPDHEIHSRSPRTGRERQWYALTGRVTQVKAEEDGDLHIELVDVDDPHSVHVVVEVPLDRHGGRSPWNPIRQTVFGWSDQTFPFETRTGHKLHLHEHLVIQVIGQAFYDAEHTGPEPNRRRQTEHVAVWEIHPVMALFERPDPDRR